MRTVPLDPEPSTVHGGARPGQPRRFGVSATPPWARWGAALAMLVACGSPAPPDPADTPQGRLCARAYSSTVHTLTEMLHGQGIEVPDLPDQATYVSACLAQGLTDAQLRCLDPKIASVDDTCAETLAEVEAQQQALSALFEEALGATAAPEPAPAPAPQEGE